MLQNRIRMSLRQSKDPGYLKSLNVRTPSLKLAPPQVQVINLYTGTSSCSLRLSKLLAKRAMLQKYAARRGTLGHLAEATD